MFVIREKVLFDAHEHVWNGEVNTSEDQFWGSSNCSLLVPCAPDLHRLPRGMSSPVGSVLLYGSMNARTGTRVIIIDIFLMLPTSALMLMLYKHCIF